MKKIIATIIAMSTTAVFAGVDYASSYVFRGTTVHEDAAIQPSMDTSILGLEVGAWASYNTGTDAFDEVDLAIGMPLTSVAGVDLSVGLCEYIYDGLESDTEASLYADTSYAGIDISVALNKVLDGTLADYTIISASYGFDLTDTIAGSVGYEIGSLDDGTVDEEAYSAVSLSAETALTDALDVAVSYTSINDGDIAGYVTEDSVLVVGISGDLF
tara:strand:+ start:52 stop:696 length:645 start_codon:yes stop_codon:yes gene_type:complete